MVTVSAHDRDGGHHLEERGGFSPDARFDFPVRGEAKSDAREHQNPEVAREDHDNNPEWDCFAGCESNVDAAQKDFVRYGIEIEPDARL